MRKLIPLLLLVGCQKVDPIYCESHPYLSACGGTGSGSDLAVIGGSVTGMGSSKGLVLQNNGSDDKPVNTDGNFVFATPIGLGSTYNVTVSVKPTQPSEDCTVANGTGTATMDVNNVAVTCMPAAYSIGGTVLGLNAGASVVLANGSDSVTVTSTMPMFQFGTKVQSGTPYNVSISTQPDPSNPCAVFGGTGTVGNSNVTTVVVNCSNNMKVLGGTVGGLDGTVVLTNTVDADMATISANGTYAFPMLVPSGANYMITVSAPPMYPPASQTCTLSKTSGQANQNVTDINVTCMTNNFHVGGSVSGLNGSVTLQNNGGDDLTRTSNGNFQFQTPLASGMGYDVTVSSQPMMQICIVSGATGAGANGDVTSVMVACQNNPTVACGSGNTCDIATQICCVTGNNTGSCKTGSTCSNGSPATCDDASDCAPNQVCCASTNGGNNKFYSSSCTAGGCQHVLCDPNASNPCPQGGTSKTWGNFSQFNECQ